MIDFADEAEAPFSVPARDRAVLDLLMHLPRGIDPAQIWDLDCGAGEYTAMLARRHPGAQVHGLDRRPAMLARARARPEPIAWRDEDAEAVEGGAGLIFSAGLSTPLEEVVEGLFDRLAPDGVLALISPGGVEALAKCHRALADRSAHLDLWSTSYMVGPGEPARWAFVIAQRA